MKMKSHLLLQTRNTHSAQKFCEANDTQWPANSYSQQTKEKIMTESKGKAFALIVLAAVVSAVVVTLLQSLILGHSSPAVTGGVVGGVTAVMAVTTLRKSSD